MPCLVKIKPDCYKKRRFQTQTENVATRASKEPIRTSERNSSSDSEDPTPRILYAAMIAPQNSLQLVKGLPTVYEPPEHSSGLRVTHIGTPECQALVASNRLC